MATQDSADREALRREIQAAIAAGRELEPDMDTHLADSALARYEQEQKARGTAPAVAQPPANNGGEMVARVIPTVAVAGVFIAILVINPSFWWAIFFLGPMLGGWWSWGGRGGHHDDEGDQATRQQYRDAKRRLKIERLESEIKRLQAGGEVEEG